MSETEVVHQPPGGESGSLAVGTILDEWRVDRFLGGGGMGEVYQVGNVRNPTEPAHALKLLKPGADPMLVALFVKEATIAGKLLHRGIVEIITSGNDHGRHFIVMELLHGQDLAARLAREGRLPISEAVRLGREISDAIAGAHEREVIHRDLKPANIFLATDGKKEALVKILDFGIANVMDEPGPLTRAGVSMGTPQYMAPEQLAALGPSRRPPATAAIDVYAIGAVLYEMLAGDFSSILPSRPLRDRRPEVPEPLAAIIGKALARNPEERFPNARELSRALQVLADDGQRIGSPGKDSRQALAVAKTLRAGAPRSEPRPPRRWFVALAVGIAVVAAAIFAGVAWRRDVALEPAEADPPQQPHSPTTAAAGAGDTPVPTARPSPASPPAPLPGQPVAVSWRPSPRAAPTARRPPERAQAGARARAAPDASRSAPPDTATATTATKTGTAASPLPTAAEAPSPTAARATDGLGGRLLIEP